MIYLHFHGYFLLQLTCSWKFHGTNSSPFCFGHLSNSQHAAGAQKIYSLVCFSLFQMRSWHFSFFVCKWAEHLPRDQTNTQNEPSLRLDIAVLMVTDLCCWVGVKGNVFDEREEEKEAEGEADFEVSELRANVVKTNLEQCAWGPCPSTTAKLFHLNIPF